MESSLLGSGTGTGRDGGEGIQRMHVRNPVVVRSITGTVRDRDGGLRDMIISFELVYIFK